MYEICIRSGDVVLVMETVDSIDSASNHVQFYKLRGMVAFYRPVLRKVA